MMEERLAAREEVGNVNGKALHGMRARKLKLCVDEGVAEPSDADAGAGADRPEEPATMTDRICMVTQGLSCRQIARLTASSAETARRYLKGSPPSVAFIRRLCDAYRLRADWLIFGTGPKHRDETPGAQSR